MPRERPERREKSEKFQTFARPKVKIARTSASGKIYIDYKDTESLKKMVSGNGKILAQTDQRQRDGAAHDHPRGQTGTIHGAFAVRHDRSLIPPI